MIDALFSSLPRSSRRARPVPSRRRKTTAPLVASTRPVPSRQKNMAPLVASTSETRHIAPRARVMPVDGARAPTRCEVCDCDVPARLMPQHERGARHRAKLRTRDSLTWRCVACDASMPARARFEHERTRSAPLERERRARRAVGGVSMRRVRGGRAGVRTRGSTSAARDIERRRFDEARRRARRRRRRRRWCRE